jgi:hypothetical protein
LGPAILGTIANNGFTVNQKKVRLQRHTERQVVTGLVSNRKVNVSRTFIRNVRAMLHNWHVKGLYTCQKEFEMKTNSMKLFRETLRGKIEFIGTVRGRDDSLYLKLLGHLATLDETAISAKARERFRQISSRSDYILNRLWVVESTMQDDSDCFQGTAFFIKDVGIITCEHVVPTGSLIEIFRRDESEHQWARIDRTNKELDVALLWARELPDYTFDYSLQFPSHGDQVFLAGFPGWSKGNSGIVEPGLVIGSFQTPHGKRFHINAAIRHGNSGGPVFNKDWRVIGIAAKGADASGIRGGTNFFEVIPIGDIFALTAGE